jgi:adenylate cyclase
MTISPLTRHRLQLVLLITCIWTILGICIEVFNSINYDPGTATYYLYFPFGENGLEHLLVTAVGPILGGLLGGSLIIFVLRTRLQRKSFGFKIFLQSLIFLALIILLIFLVSAINALLTDRENFFRIFYDEVFNMRVLRLVVIWFTVVSFTLIILDVSDKYGPGVLWRMILGRYHIPRTVERIFMFMDLTDSTQWAERLGDKRYFILLHTLYDLTTEPVLNSEGEIYQYVGDELIVSWSLAEGLKNTNCLRCFFQIRETIAHRSDWFISQFGAVPVFKAAFHMGDVVAGEIGVIKKDIVYAGDVLNSTARILSLVKEFGEEMLVSDPIYQHLSMNSGYVFEFQDSLVLRGKTTATKIYGVRSSP